MDLEKRRPRPEQPLYEVRVLNRDRDLLPGSTEENFGHSEAKLIVGYFQKGAQDRQTQVNEAVAEFFELSDTITNPVVANIGILPGVSKEDIHLPRRMSNHVRAKMIEFNKTAV